MIWVCPKCSFEAAISLFNAANIRHSCALEFVVALLKSGPKSTGEVARSLGITKRGAANRLARLRAQGRIAYANLIAFDGGYVWALVASPEATHQP